ncbi:hypothetical protein AXF14_01630 [Actinomyces radicidentis]|uniref:Glycosyltransferase 2-like domain-containing protein n=1 Tax=Actinomyces radicidentis TaxID=111015 RepID=A0A109W239_ACTRD|nr:hypothetical protein AXF14_01630 [Actinomyces radicidentis]
MTAVLVSPGPDLEVTRRSVALSTGNTVRCVEIDWARPEALRAVEELDVADDWLLLLRAGDEVEPGALASVTSFGEALGADLVTADRVEGGEIHRVQRWSSSLFEQLPYVGRALVARSRLLAAVARETTDGGRWESEWDLQLHLVEHAEQPRHCPVTLLRQTTPVGTGGVGGRLRSLRRHLNATGRPRSVARISLAGPATPRVRPPSTHRWPEVSAIVPTAFARRPLADGAEAVLVEQLLECLTLATDDGVSLEVVLVVGEQAPDASIASARAIAETAGLDVVVVRTTGPFNFSKAVNEGARAAHGEVLLLLNDDVQPIASGWLPEMLGALAQPGVTAAGARLLFDDGRIQHVGVVVPPDGPPFHPQIFERDDPLDPLAHADVDYVAVTGACLLTRHADFDAVGGMEESLPLNFNDVDLCLRLGRAGGRIVCVNAARLIHRESSTREAVLTSSETSRALQWRDGAVSDPHVEYWG